HIGLRGRAQDHRLAVDLRLPQARLEAAFEGALDLVARRWTGQLAQAEVAAQGLPAFVLEAPAALRLREGIVELEPACLASDPARVCAALRPVGAARRIAFRLQGFELPMLKPWLGGLQVEG